MLTPVSFSPLEHSHNLVYTVDNLKRLYNMIDSVDSCCCRCCSVMGRSRAEDQDEVTGRKFKIASYVVSAVGAVVGLTIIIVLCVTLTGTSYSYSSSCMPYGSCTYGRYLAYSNCYLCCSYSYSCFYGTNPLSGTCCTGN